jgi:inorganic phosphate transporter, PiT family
MFGSLAQGSLPGYPVSTIHVVSGGIAGTMVGGGVQRATIWQIAAACF